MKAFNSRVLVIDDDETIRDSFREILSPKRANDDSALRLKRAEAALFGDGADESPKRGRRSSATFDFFFEEASNGKKGLEMVRKAIDEDRPYAVVFVDMRMPGWDGLETVKRLREVDTRAEIVFVTAYTDHSIEEIVKAVGHNVSYHCKPFAAEEIEQIATKAVFEWNRTSNLEELINSIASLRAQRWQIKPLLCNILQQVAELLGADSALIAGRSNDRFEKLYAIGSLLNDDLSDRFLSSLPPEALDNRHYFFQNNEMVYFRLEKFGIVAIFETNENFHDERIYLVRLFLEQAGMAIRNIDLQEALIRKEKLSAIGEATSMIAHDLNNFFSSVGLGLDVLEEELEGKPSALLILESVKSSAGECVALINDILDYAGNKEVRRSPVDMRCVVENVRVKMGQCFAGTRVTVEADPEVSLVFSGDAGKIFRAVYNLAKNAAEVMRDHQVPDPRIGISVTKSGASLIVRIADNGPGIPEEVQPSLFQPFSTFGKARGTGLGLAIVKQFVEGHQGSVSFETSGSGTAFKLMIPVA